MQKRSRRRSLSYLSFPKIISARIDDEDPPERVWRQWFRFAGPPDVEEHPSATPCACALGCSTSHSRREFAAGALRQKPAFGRGTRGARCRSDVPQSHFAKVSSGKLACRGYPWL